MPALVQDMMQADLEHFNRENATGRDYSVRNQFE